MRDSRPTVVRLSPEDRVILFGAKPYLPEAEVQKLQCLLTGDNIDWDLLVTRAMHHRCSELLYWNLRGMPEGTVPATLLEKLRCHYAYAQLHISYSLKILGDILAHLNRKRVQIVLLKGPALATTIYPDIRLRTFCDVDVLARPRHWPEIRDTLLALGYESQAGLASLSPDSVQAYCFPFRHIEFRHSSDVLAPPLEIHFHVYPQSEQRDGRLWDRAQEISIGSAQCLVMCPEDLLAYLCIHLNHHSYKRLKWFVDIDALLTVHETNLRWDLLLAEHGGQGSGLAMYYALKFTHQLLRCPIPEKILEALRPPWYQRKLFELAWDQQEILSLTSEYKSHRTFRNTLLTIDKPKKMIPFIGRAVLPPLSWVRSRYPDHAGSTVVLYLNHLRDVLQGRYHQP